MTRATKHRDRAHARIYADWLDLPAWSHLSLAAKALLVEMLARYRPGDNGLLEWPVRKCAALLRCSLSTASVALNESEECGWIAVTRVGSFSRKSRSSLYRLTMFQNDVTGEPPTRDFETWQPNGSVRRCRIAKARSAVRPGKQHSPTPVTILSVPGNDPLSKSACLSVSESLRNSRLVKNMLAENKPVAMPMRARGRHS